MEREEVTREAVLDGQFLSPPVNRNSSGGPDITTKGHRMHFSWSDAIHWAQTATEVGRAIGHYGRLLFH
jgi:hypothetical protein